MYTREMTLAHHLWICDLVRRCFSRNITLFREKQDLLSVAGSGTHALADGWEPREQRRFFGKKRRLFEKQDCVVEKTIAFPWPYGVMGRMGCKRGPWADA